MSNKPFLVSPSLYLVSKSTDTIDRAAVGFIVAQGGSL